MPGNKHKSYSNFDSVILIEHTHNQTIAEVNSAIEGFFLRIYGFEELDHPFPDAKTSILPIPTLGTKNHIVNPQLTAIRSAMSS
jgi:hypothetical protein